MTVNLLFPVTAPDLVCIDDCDPLGRETTSEAQNLAQDCYHSILCLPGGNLDAPDRGVGAMLYLSGTEDDLARLPSAIEPDLAKDTRIVACSAELLRQPDGTFLLNVNVQPTAGAVMPLSYAYSRTSGLVPA